MKQRAVRVSEWSGRIYNIRTGAITVYIQGIDNLLAVGALITYVQ